MISNKDETSGAKKKTGICSLTVNDSAKLVLFLNEPLIFSDFNDYWLAWETLQV